MEIVKDPKPESSSPSPQPEPQAPAKSEGTPIVLNVLAGDMAEWKRSRLDWASAERSVGVTRMQARAMRQAAAKAEAEDEAAQVACENARAVHQKFHADLLARYSVPEGMVLDVDAGKFVRPEAAKKE